MGTTRVIQRTIASRQSVYRTCLDAAAVAQWLVPDGMRSEVHIFEPHEGGRFRISLSYDVPDAAGKTRGNTDTFHGHFVRLVPDELIVETVEFETSVPALTGEMTITIALRELPGGGTEIDYLHEGVPDAVSPADNEQGTRMSLAKLAALAEQG